MSALAVENDPSYDDYQASVSPIAAPGAARSATAARSTDDDLLDHVDEVIASLDGSTLIDDSADALTDGSDRHGPLASLCAKFHAILLGRHAESLLDDIDALPGEAGVWTAPSWAWIHSRIKVGRKERAADGSRLRMPIRIDWSEGPVFLIAPGPEQALPWTAVGMGHTGADAVPASAVDGLYEPRVVERASGVPTAVTVPLLSRHEIVRELQALVAAGRTARWEILDYLEPYVTKALHVAHSSVSHELARGWGGNHQVLLDDTKLESIRNQMLLGDDQHPGKVSQMLERCLRLETFERVEPIKYIKESLRRDANTAIRDSIGDPHIGPKIRRVARETGLRDIDDLVEAYRQQYPSDRLSKDRAVMALSVAPDAMASWWGLNAFDVD